MNKLIWHSFTKKFALTKTLRFELRPIGKTRENINKNLQFDEKLQTFLVDQDIENAYQVLKPIFDKIHGEFITGALESKTAKIITFSKYFSLVEKRRSEQDKNKKQHLNKQIEIEEKKLRMQFEKAYSEVGEVFKNKVGFDSKKKNILKKSGFKVLTEVGILEYIRRNVNEFIGVETRDNKVLSKDDILNAIKRFKGFFTYFSGFSQNRENYYTTKQEKSTAVATRIVNDNLPRFCDNILVFTDKMDEYMGIYKYLKSKKIVLEDKKNNELYPIEKDLFVISNFNEYLTQKGIEVYNKAVGNANFLINLYNHKTNLIPS